MKGNIRRLLQWLHPDRKRMALATVLQGGTVSAGIGLMATSAWLISAAALHPSIAVLQLSIVGVRFFGIARGALRYAERLVSHDVTLRLLSGLRVKVFGALEPLVPARLPDQRSGDILARLVVDVDTLEHVYVRLLGPTIAAALITVLVTLVLAAYHPALSAAAVVGLAAGGLAVPWLAWRRGSRAGDAVVRSRARLHAQLVDGVQGIAELLAFGAVSAHQRDVAATGTAMGAAQLRFAKASSLGASLTGLAADITALAVLALAIHLLSEGRMDGTHLAVVTLLTLAAFEAVAGLPAAYQSLGAIRTAASRVFELLDAAPTVREPERPASPPPGIGLDVRRLHFAYPPRRTPVLRDVTLAVAPGRPVALVGASGSGKSTLAHILMRFWDTPPGTVFLDGCDVATLRADDVRARIAFVSQRTHLFAATIRENLRMARPDASDAAIDEAIARARLDAVIQTLPQGQDTWIGEQGLHLSGGERQRMALARAFLKNAPIVVLDEPTAHLDAITERDILSEVHRLAADHAVLLITHRLVGLEAMDEIIVLRDGEVVERGRYADLVARDGLFAGMLRIQRGGVNATGD